MPPKRPSTPDGAVPSDINTDIGTTLMPPPPPPPTTPSSKRRRTSHTNHTSHTTITRTPSTTAPESLFFALPLPPPYNTSSPPDAANNQPPTDSQFVAFLHSVIETLPAPTQALYASAMRNLAPEKTPELTGEMRASLTSAVTGFVVHLPTADWKGGFLTRLAQSEVSGQELVLWADTITAALKAFSGVGGYLALTSPSSPGSVGSPTPTVQSADPAAPNRTHNNSSSSTGRSGSIRASTLTRDGNACILTSAKGPIALEVAHIIPFSVRGAKANAFWGFLGLFLGDQSAERVRWATLQLANGEVRAEQTQTDTVVSPVAVGELANCITLAASAHRYFDAGAIEILPVPGSGNWSGDYDPSVALSYNVRLSFPGQALLPLSRYVYSDGTPPQLLSSTQVAPGDIITLATADPAQWPLPHPLLLQLHALCGRLKRLRAAAGWPVLPYTDGSEYEVGWGEEEVLVWDEDEDEDEMIKARWEGECEGAAPGVLGCSVETEPESCMEGIGKKRKYDAAMREAQEGKGGEDKILEWPRKVGVVMGEMGMREEERWRLAKRRGREEAAGLGAGF